MTSSGNKFRLKTALDFSMISYYHKKSYIFQNCLKIREKNVKIKFPNGMIKYSFFKNVIFPNKPKIGK